MREGLPVAIVLAACCSGLPAAPRRFTILHTNDLHSHVQGVSPEPDYPPLEPDLLAAGALLAAHQVRRMRRRAG